MHVSDLKQALRATETGLEIRVKVVPGASRSAVVGMLGDRLKVAVSAVAEGGKANKAVCALIAQALNVNKSAVRVASGHARPEKVIAIDRLSVEAVCAALGNPDAHNRGPGQRR